MLVAVGCLCLGGGEEACDQVADRSQEEDSCRRLSHQDPQWRQLAHGKDLIGCHTINKSRQTLAGDFQHYTGTLYEDGSEFDSSIPRFFTIGSVKDGLRAYSTTVQGSAIDLPAGNRQSDQGVGPGAGEFSDQDTSCKMGGGWLMAEKCVNKNPLHPAGRHVRG